MCVGVFTGDPPPQPGPAAPQPSEPSEPSEPPLELSNREKWALLNKGSHAVNLSVNIRSEVKIHCCHGQQDFGVDLKRSVFITSLPRADDKRRENCSIRTVGLFKKKYSIHLLLSMHCNSYSWSQFYCVHPKVLNPKVQRALRLLDHWILDSDKRKLIQTGETKEETVQTFWQNQFIIYGSITSPSGALCSVEK